ncbi:hypothetical protein Hanom_Chr03g00261041 [Helianthus anomalus]
MIHGNHISLCSQPHLNTQLAPITLWFLFASFQQPVLHLASQQSEPPKLFES